LKNDIVWQGITYPRFPIEVKGFEKSGRGALPQPKARVSNTGGLIGALCREYQDLIGTRVTRKRTFLKYLDAVNFPGGVNPTANPAMAFMDEVWYVSRKSREEAVIIEFELKAAFDVSNKKLPGRQFVRICRWKYRGPYCTYSGPPVADVYDQPTTDPAEDRCGKRVPSCQLRFGEDSRLPHGGFPGAGMVR
jgi:lambda family phage minor tail protein L